MQNKNLRKALAVSMAIAMETAAPADLPTAEPQTAVPPHPQAVSLIHPSL